MATLGEQAVGSIVKLNVGGVATNFIVVHQGLPGSMYDSSCDGTWLLMESIYEKRSMNSTQSNDYEKNSINTYLNNTFFGLFDDDAQGAIKQVKIPYRPGNGSSTTVSDGANGLSTKVFLLSTAECNYISESDTATEGSVLDCFNGESTKRIAYYDGTATAWWTRSPRLTGFGGTMSAFINGKGEILGTSASTVYGIRPALILPYELNVSDNGLVDGTIASARAITGSVNIGGELRELTGKGYINIGGELRELCDAKINIDGKLRSLKG